MSFKKLFRNKNLALGKNLDSFGIKNFAFGKNPGFRSAQIKNGFIVLLLDILLVLAVFIISIISLLRDRETLASIINAFKKSF